MVTVVSGLNNKDWRDYQDYMKISSCFPIFFIVLQNVNTGSEIKLIVKLWNPVLMLVRFSDFYTWISICVCVVGRACLSNVNSTNLSFISGSISRLKIKWTNVLKFGPGPPSLSRPMMTVFQPLPSCSLCRHCVYRATLLIVSLFKTVMLNLRKNR